MQYLDWYLALSTHCLYLLLLNFANDPRFLTNSDRVVNRAALDAVIVSVFSIRLLSEIRPKLDLAGIAYGEVRSLDDLSRHPALRRQDTIINGKLTKTVASPINGSKQAKARIPELGAQNLLIRQEFMGAQKPDGRRIPRKKTS